ncbi:2Fe-2S iron-sulfur cluster-binding protein [Massilia sp. AB1]|uniref:2Fe-2S iron-sulfur cluster-binding protein n=1 Tax=Massilia sp. AB1 TaxID=2823371 RepID=UPI001B82D9FE|nr:2Fe-2S iron-sulfur cluster-binding protein [Massilia sp. AB1]MBQ5940629.1 pyridoxamine 5'-phosphate oxidase family protein [Massilia sp. AB1]
MARAFSSIAYTPSVRRAQERYGSRAANAGFDIDPNTRDRVSERDAAFIERVETFFMASSGENGWPYVQHRGGPRGFLKVLDERTIGFADFAGNRQYISAGNLEHDARVMLILMDFATRGRLKIWGRARIVHERDEPELVAKLEVPAYRARIERAYVITVEAFDFNCPQHIVQRFSEEELVEMAAEPAGRAMLGKLLKLAPDAPASLGSGPLSLVVSGMRQLTPLVRAYSLASADGAPLPEVAPGAHLALPVRLQDGREEVRHYSIVSAARAGKDWEVAVLRRDEDGGSAAVQRNYQLGTVLHCALPRNDFVLHTDARPAVLIAGGIGITPLLPMCEALAARGTPWQLHYAGRTRAQLAYRGELPPGARIYADGERLELKRIVADAPPDAVFYVCGPERLLAAVQASGIDPARLRFERFDAPAGGQAVELVLRRSGVTVQVPSAQSLLDAIRAAGIDAPSDCRLGNCGACAVKVLEGVPEHRDAVLTRSERELAGLMCPCVSRARSERLVLDL